MKTSILYQDTRQVQHWGIKRKESNKYLKIHEKKIKIRFNYLSTSCAIEITIKTSISGVDKARRSLYNLLTVINAVDDVQTTYVVYSK
jgi:hypothetical protein